jgi:hypothetical protein
MKPMAFVCTAVTYNKQFGIHLRLHWHSDISDACWIHFALEPADTAQPCPMVGSGSTGNPTPQAGGSGFKGI